MGHTSEHVEKRDSSGELDGPVDQICHGDDNYDEAAVRDEAPDVELDEVDHEAGDCRSMCSSPGGAK